MISFVTCIKLMTNGIDFADRLRLYVESIVTHCAVPYEIIIVEDRCPRNARYLSQVLSDEWLLLRGARVVMYEASYPNPHGYNIIEAYAKNVGILEAKHPFICVTNCDIVFGPCFFEFLPSAVPNVFYRFLQYETVSVETTVDSVLGSPCKCINPDLADKSKWTLNAIAYKSGDIMLMDARAWRQIRGYPENEVWVHSDLIVCCVAHNNQIAVDVPPNVRIYTSPQQRSLVAQPFELQQAYHYLSRLTCN